MATQNNTRKSNSRSYSTNKKNNTRRTSQSSKNTRNYEPLEDELVNEIFLIIVLAIAVFFFLCNFKILGSFGNKVSDIMFGIFGFPNYVMPIVIGVLVVFSLVNVGNPIMTRKVIASIVFYFMIAFTCELISHTPDKELPIDVKGIFMYSFENHKGGGFLGGVFGYYAYKWLDMVGSILLICVCSIICLVIITNRSFIKTVKDSSQKAYERGYNNAQRLHDRSQTRKDERQRKLEDRRIRKEALEDEKTIREVSGVKTYNFVAEEEINKASDNMHEINLTNLDEEFENRNVDIKIHGVDINEQNDEDAPIPIKNHVSFQSNVIQDEPEMDDEDDVFIAPPQTKVKSFSEGSSVSANNSVTPKTRAGKNEKPYKIPPLDLLKKGKNTSSSNSQELKETAKKLETVLASFGVKVTVTDISQGPAVTRYEMIPETGVKVSKILSLQDDIKLNLAAADIRIEAPIPGKAAIGIEVPKKESSAVMLRDLLEAKEFKEASSKISFAVGKDLSGKVVVTDIAKMPHMLIAGATGSGKSVCINTLIMSILYKAKPDEVKLIMIDPKVVELSVYNGIPHLLIPVVTDPKKASASLAWAVAEMNDRYQKFADYGVRDLAGYNEKIKDETDENNNPIKPMYQLVVIVDELADMMMVAGKEVEESICRLAQLARAAGIHLILATQRPSVDVITGLIKANMPSRVAFSVSSGVDSRTILDMNGAEKLLGKGDMLFYPQGYTKPARVQGALVSDNEVSDVVSYLKNWTLGNNNDENDQNDISQKINSLAQSNSSSPSAGNSGDVSSDSDEDEYFYEAGRLIVESGKCSIGMLQRKFKIGFNRAARIMDSLSDAGVVGPDEGTKPRTILMTPEEFEDFIIQ